MAGGVPVQGGSDDVSMGEVVRRLIRIESKLDVELAGFARAADVDRELAQVRADVAEIRSWIGWGVKIVLGLVLAALVGLVLKGGGAL